MTEVETSCLDEQILCDLVRAQAVGRIDTVVGHQRIRLAAEGDHALAVCGTGGNAFDFIGLLLHGDGGIPWKTALWPGIMAHRSPAYTPTSLSG